jgi:hypothetical protein
MEGLIMTTLTAYQNQRLHRAEDTVNSGEGMRALLFALTAIVLLCLAFICASMGNHTVPMQNTDPMMYLTQQF